MLSYKVTPQKSELSSGYLPHIPNTVTPVWFERARSELYEKVTALSAQGTTFGIVRHASYDYQRELFADSEVLINTWISHIGSSSVVCHQEAWQSGQLAVVAEVVLVIINEKKRIKAVIEGDAEAYLKKLVKST